MSIVFVLPQPRKSYFRKYV